MSEHAVVGVGRSIGRAWTALLGDPLRRNSYALILGTAVTSGLGFVFWVVAARWLSPAVIGIGAALLSTITLLANIASLGLENCFARFLPGAGRSARRLILTSYALSGTTAMVAAAVFLVGQPVWAPQLGFLRASPASMATFVAASGVYVIFVLQDNVLIGMRRTVWVPVQNAIGSVLKLASLPLVMVLGSWAIFAATLLPAGLLVVGITALVLWYARRDARAAHDRPGDETPVPVSQLVHFAAWDHLANLLWLGTGDVMTLIVLARAGADASAFYSMAYTIGYTLYLVSSNVGSALIAESAHDPGGAARHARAGLRQTAMIVVPGALGGIVVAPLLMALFGPDYAAQGTLTLQLILASALPQMLVYVGVSTARVRRDMRTVVGVYVVLSVGMWVGSWIGLSVWGISGVGAAWLVNQCLVAAVLLLTGRTGLWTGRVTRRSALTVALNARRAYRRRRNRGRARRRIGQTLTASGLLAVSDVRMLPSDSDTLVMAVTAASEPLVVKVAASSAAAAGLDRHVAMVGTLRAVAPPTVTSVLPGIVTRGSTFLVETRLPGAVPRGSSLEAPVNAACVGAISGIHRATAAMRVVDEDLVGRWVDAPIRDVSRACGAQRPRLALEELSRRLRAVLLGREVLAAVVHGDFWPGNVLVGHDEDGVIVTGIIDWENGHDIGLPDVDLVHWWLASSPLDFGAAVRAALHDPDTVRDGLAAWGVELPNPHLPLTDVVVLAWLWHVSGGLTRAIANRPGAFWFRRNVLAVTETVASGDHLIATGGQR